jgi:streptogramin lyase/plastocyanin
MGELFMTRNKRIFTVPVLALLLAGTGWMVRPSAARAQAHSLKPPAQTGTEAVTIGGAKRIYVVRLSNEAPYYSPASTDVQVGDAVRWVNEGASDTHSVYFSSGTYAAPSILPGTESCHRFDREGEFEYTCRFHPWMHGTVVVGPKRLPSVQVQAPASVELRDAEFMVGPQATWLLQTSPGPQAFQISPVGTLTPHHLPISSVAGTRFAIEPGGAIWLLQAPYASLLRYDLTARSSKEYKLEAPLDPGMPLGFAGSKLWSFDSGSGRFLAFDPGTGKVQWSSPQKIGAPPVEMASTPAGRVFLVENGRHVAAIFDSAQQKTTEFDFGPVARLSSVAAGADDGWFTDAGRNKLLQAHDGWIYEHTISSLASGPQGLSVTDTGAVWFAETEVGRLGHFNKGKISEFALPEGARPLRVAADAERHLWIMEAAGHALRRVEAGKIDALEADLNASPCPPSPPENTSLPGGNRAGSH